MLENVNNSPGFSLNRLTFPEYGKLFEENGFFLCFINSKTANIHWWQWCAQKPREQSRSVCYLFPRCQGGKIKVFNNCIFFSQFESTMTSQLKHFPVGFQALCIVLSDQISGTASLFQVANCKNHPIFMANRVESGQFSVSPFDAQSIFFHFQPKVFSQRLFSKQFLN